jgi:signal transduction histidine kinase
MKKWSLKVKVGVYSALLTMVALVAGAAVLMPVLYFHQVAQLDETLENDSNEFLRDLQNFKGAPVDPRRPLARKFIPLSLQTRYLVIEGPEGQILYRSNNLRGASLEGEPGQTQTVELFGRNCRIGAWQEGPYLVRIGTRLGAIERFQKDLRRGLLLALPVVGLVVFIGGHWLGRRAVAPVADLSAAAERISAAAPQERLPMPATNDEIARLTEVLNRSFDRLQASYESATRFSADASHQLKTPVAVLRAGLDHLSRETGLTGPQASEIAVLRQQTRRLTALIDDLLLLAQADAGRLALEAEEIDLKPLIAAAEDDLQALVSDRDIRVEDELPESLIAKADRRRVMLVLQNLVENAAKYTPEGGTVKVSARQEDGWAVVSVANTGAAIPEEVREEIFERFRRGPAVGENVRGHGLGLNIARELIRAHGGELGAGAFRQGVPVRLEPILRTFVVLLAPLAEIAGERFVAGLFRSHVEREVHGVRQIGFAQDVAEAAARLVAEGAGRGFHEPIPHSHRIGAGPGIESTGNALAGLGGGQRAQPIERRLRFNRAPSGADVGDHFAAGFRG